MTKIKNYPLDLEVNGGDKWIGTDSASLAKLTKNFTPDNLAKYYNDKEVVESVNQMRFFYDTVDPGDDRASGSFSFETEVGPIVPFSSISNLVFSKYTMGNDAVNNFMTDIVNSIIIIQKADNPDIYAFYALNSYEVDPLNSDFYNVSITYSSGTGSIEEDEDYLVSLIQFAGAAGVQTILGSEFIDSTLTGVGEVTISLSATGTPSNLTGLRGDNSWGTLGLEALDEGGEVGYLGTPPAIGWRLIGRDPENYGPIGQNSVDFSTSNEATNENGSVGNGSVTFGFNNRNTQTGTLMLGSLNTTEVYDIYQGGNLITGYDINVYGSTYFSHIGAYRSTIGTPGQNYTQSVVYHSIISGDGINFYAGRDSGAVGGGLISGSTGCFTVGVGNEDLTIRTSNYIVNYYNDYGPRFIVGCGTYQPLTQAITRQNGFVVMSDGTATFPILTNAMIDAAGADSAVTKGWVNSGPALTSEQVRIEVKNTSGVTLTKGTPVYITGTVGATIRAEVAAADASDPAKMPSVGVLAQDLINNADGYAVTGGFLTNITTDPIDGLTPTENDTVYVKAGGGLTLTKPTGSDLIQNIAKVGKVSGGNAGSLVISSILRTNDVPNLTTGKIWVGTAANTAESGVVYLDEGNGRMGIGTTTPATKLDVVGDSEFNGEVRISSNNVHVNDKLLNIVDGGTGKEGIHIRTGQPTIDFQDWNTGGKGEITSDDGNISIQADVANTKASSNITFFVDASEKMRIDSSGNVGIGTTSPTYKLELGSGDFSLPLGSVIRFGPQLGVTKASNGKLSLYGGTGATTAGGIDLYRWNGAAYSTALRLSNTGQIQLDEYGSGTFTGTATQRLAVDSSGNVIEIPIGSGPVDGSGTANYLTYWSDTDTIAASKILQTSTGYQILGNSGANYTKLQLLSPATKTLSLFEITNGSDENNASATIYGRGDSSYPTINAISRGTGTTQAINFAIDSSEKMRINTNGNVGIGTTSPGAKLDVEGRVDFASDIRLRGQDTSLNIGVVRLFVDATNNFFIDPGNAGTALSTFKSTGAIQLGNYGSGTFTGTATQRLAVDSSGNVIEIPIGSGPVDGSGTANYITKWSDADTITDSLLYDNGTQVLIGATSSAFSDDLYLHNTSGYAVSGWRVGTTTTYVGKLFNNSGVLSLEADGTRSIGFKNITNGEIVRIDGVNSRVGIGTTSPAFKLSVNSGTDNTIARFASTDGTGTIVVADNAGSAYFSRLSNKIQIGGTSGDSALNLTVLDTGNVGIGITSPTHKLYVQGNNGPLLVTREITTPNQARIGIGESNPSTALDFGSYSDGIISGTASLRFSNGSKISELGTTRLAFQADAGYFFYPTTATPSADVYGVDIRHLRDSAVNTTDAVLEVNNSANSSLMLVRSDGNVGIGTTSPAAKLDVAGNLKVGNNATIFSDGSITLDIDNNNDQTDRALRVTHNGATNELFRIQEDGNVGIGTATPAAKLDVNGGVRVADDAATASATNVGTLRYRTSGNNSYVDMCMQTGAATYAWVNIVQNNW